jgi:hypothetical protein
VVGALGLEVRDQDVQRGQLGFADAAAQQVFVPFARVEAPLHVHLDNRDRIGLLVLAELQHGADVAFDEDLVPLLVEGKEPGALVPIDDRIAREHEPPRLVTQDSGHGPAISLSVGCTQGLRGLRGRGERLLRPALPLAEDRRQKE